MRELLTECLLRFYQALLDIGVGLAQAFSMRYAMDIGKRSELITVLDHINYALWRMRWYRGLEAWHQAQGARILAMAGI